MTRIGWCTAQALTATLIATSVSAQTAAAPDGRKVERVFITQTSGGEIEGRLLHLGPETLSLLTDEGRRDLPLENVLRIDRRGDSVRNGIIIGALVEAGAAAVFARRAFHHPRAVFQIVGGNAAFGAMVGAGIDALNVGRTTIYRADLEARQPSRAGAGLSIRFRF